MIIDGKQVSQEILKELKEEIWGKNLKLSLAAVLVSGPVRGPTRLKGVVGRRSLFEGRLTSNGTGIKKFVELKGKAAREIGAEFTLFDFPETISEDQLQKEVRKIVQDDSNKGVLVELPLPKEVNTRNILNEISLEKDVDVLSQKAQELFYVLEPPKGVRARVLPPAVEAVKIVLEKYGISPNGKKVAVFGQGTLVGKPVSYWFEQQGAEVFKIDEFTKNPERYSRKADVVVSGVGKPDLIKGDMVQNGVVVFDFGYENKEGKMTGDVEFKSVSPKASFITPVPGGMGPIVIAAVLKNLVKLLTFHV